MSNVHRHRRPMDLDCYRVINPFSSTKTSRELESRKISILFSLLPLRIEDFQVITHDGSIINQVRTLLFSLKDLLLCLSLADSRCSDQGISHPTINQCICAPGFYGDQCQFSQYSLLFSFSFNVGSVLFEVVRRVITVKNVIFVVRLERMTNLVEVY